MHVYIRSYTRTYAVTTLHASCMNAYVYASHKIVRYTFIHILAELAVEVMISIALTIHAYSGASK